MAPATSNCGPTGTLIIAGSSTVLPVAKKWAASYMEMCPDVAVTVEGGGSSSGAGRVCDNAEKGEPAVIGNMSRDWKDTEATVGADGYTFSCLKGDTGRKAVQVDVAIYGLSVVTQNGGAGNSCIQTLGGLTVDQLRWIFSSCGAVELEASGWSPATVANSDDDDATHLWSELIVDCPAVEIKIAGPDDQSGTYEHMSETIFPDMENGEIFDSIRMEACVSSSNDTVLVTFLQENEDAIAHFGFACRSKNIGSLSAAAIEIADGAMVLPDAATVGDGRQAKVQLLWVVVPWSSFRTAFAHSLTFSAQLQSIGSAHFYEHPR